MSYEYYMDLAIKEAYKAKERNEVPIGAVIIKDNHVISACYNHKTISSIATYHAEILAIEEACRKLGTWYLDDCTLITTVEPCMMCTGAIIQARIPKVVYGTKNEAFGYLSKCNNNKIEIIGKIKEEESRQLLSSFFKEKRLEKNN